MEPLFVTVTNEIGWCVEYRGTEIFIDFRTFMQRKLQNDHATRISHVHS
jgi:hypothetical protein